MITLLTADSCRRKELSLGEEIRRDLQERGFETISQSTVSRLLKLLGVIKFEMPKG